MNIVANNLREAYTRTIVAFLGSIFYRDIINREKFVELNEKSKKSMSVYRLKGDILMKEHQTLTEILDCQVKVHAPGLSSEIWKSADFTHDFRASMDFGANSDAVKGAGENQGGASGE